MQAALLPPSWSYAMPLALVLSLLQAGCSSVPASAAGKADPCARSEASMECQVERYNNVNAD